MVRDRVEPGTIYHAERLADHDRGLQFEWSGRLFVPGADQQRSPRNRCDGRKKTWQHQGIGTLLIEQAKRWGRDHRYSFLHVKTVAEGWYEEYDQTNRFYQKCGFQKLEVLPDLWDENNPCQIYILTIK